MKNMKLPKEVRNKTLGELTKRDLRVVHNSLHLFQHIRTTYKELWEILGPALDIKRRMGFCAANLSCTNMTDGKRRACDQCAKKIRMAATSRGEKPRRLSAYQQWRRAQ